MVIMFPSGKAGETKFTLIAEHLKHSSSVIIAMIRWGWGCILVYQKERTKKWYNVPKTTG